MTLDVFLANYFALFTQEEFEFQLKWLNKFNIDKGPSRTMTGINLSLLTADSEHLC